MGPLQIDRACRVEVCTSLLSFSRIMDWLSTIIIKDEKCIVHVNYRRRRQWVDADYSPEPEPKLNRHTRKIMCLVGFAQNFILRVASRKYPYHR